MKTILSIQSHVAYGHVGNCAAVFPLQRMGHEVIAINTVQFSNHTGYGDWGGQVFGADHIRDILAGLKRRGVLDRVDALLTGYLGDFAIGDIILETLETLPASAVWLCDPVIGDVGRGVFVRDGIPDYFKYRALPCANIITPNQFELEYLTAHRIETLDHAKEACRIAHEMGPEVILLTSLIHDKTPKDRIEMMVSVKGGEFYTVSTPRLHFDVAPNGGGDCTAAVFLSHYLHGETIEATLKKTAASIFKVFEKTKTAGNRELALIQAQDDFVHPDVSVVTYL